MRSIAHTTSPRRSTVAAAPRPFAHWRRWAIVSLLGGIPALLLAQPITSRGDGFLFRRPSISLSLRGGYDRPMGGSDVFNFVREQLTLNRNSLATVGLQGDFAIHATERLAVVLSGTTAARNAASEFRSFIDNNDQPIEQTTTLKRQTGAVGVRYALTKPGEKFGQFAWVPNRFAPFVGGGVGFTSWEFSQAGDFVDFQTNAVFSRVGDNKFRSDGTTAMYYGNIGADFSLSPRYALTADVRYSWARAPMSSRQSTSRNDFQGFNPIDLSGTAATFGITVRY
jgi:hypothetical protein